MAGLKRYWLPAILSREQLLLAWIATPELLDSILLLPLLVVVHAGGLFVESKEKGRAEGGRLAGADVLAYGVPALFLAICLLALAPGMPAWLTLLVAGEGLLCLIPLRLWRTQALALAATGHLVVLALRGGAPLLLPLLLVFFPLAWFFWKVTEGISFPLASLPFHLRPSERRRLQGLRRGVSMDPGGAVRGALQLVPILVVAGLLFLLIPRGPWEVWSGGEEQGEAETVRRKVRKGAKDRPGLPHLTEGMSLDQSSGMEMDHWIVMRVRCTGLAGEPRADLGAIRMRSAAYNNYRDGRWSSTFREYVVNSDPVRLGGDGPWRRLPWAPALPPPLAPRLPAGSGEFIRQEVVAEYLKSRVVLALPGLALIRGAGVHATGADTALFPGPAVEERAYTVISWRGGRQDDGLRLAAPGPWLQGVEPRPRIADLARRIIGRGELGALPASAQFQAARRLGAHLAERCQYTLAALPKAETDPVEAFLFDHRRGSCRHFASAMALLLRSVGVPSRVVTGYHTGEKAPNEEVYLVRNRHAHAWVEMFLPGRGWTTIDPTPPADRPDGLVGERRDPALAGLAPEGAAEGPGLLERLRGFGSADQEAILRFLAAWWPYGLGLLLLLLLLFRLSARTLGFRSVPDRPTRLAPPSTPVRLFLARLAKAGYRKGRHETLHEVAARAAATLAPDPLDQLTRDLADIHYGGHPLTPERRRRIHTNLTRLA